MAARDQVDVGVGHQLRARWAGDEEVLSITVLYWIQEYDIQLAELLLSQFAGAHPLDPNLLRSCPHHAGIVDTGLRWQIRGYVVDQPDELYMPLWSCDYAAVSLDALVDLGQLLLLLIHVHLRLYPIYVGAGLWIAGFNDKIQRRSAALIAPLLAISVTRGRWVVRGGLPARIHKLGVLHDRIRLRTTVRAKA